MKFTDGFWQLRPGVRALYAQEAVDIREVETIDGPGLRVLAPTKVIERRGDTLNRPVLTTTLSSPAEGVVRVRIEHHTGRGRGCSFPLPGAGRGAGAVDAEAGVLRSGALEARVTAGAPWALSFRSDGRLLTASAAKAQAYVTLDEGAQVDRAIVDPAGSSPPRTFVHEQLDLGVGELVYGLGERFGPLVKNGQSVDIWNADGGTSSEQAYKNVPLYVSNRGYGVLVNDPGHVSFEVGLRGGRARAVLRRGRGSGVLRLRRPDPKDVLSRYTALTGGPGRAGMVVRPVAVHELHHRLRRGDRHLVHRRDGPPRAARVGVPLRLLLDARVPVVRLRVGSPRFPDPDGMLRRLHEARPARVCVWINPYIGQASPLFAEAAEAGYLVRRADGSVWQWDLWQAGMGLVDFTDPDATRWFQEHLRRLVRQGVDCFKTDFGERIPLDVVYADGTAPDRMHNLYTELYNRAVYDVLVQERGEGDAVLFARSATAGGQSMPVHWGGDSTSTFASMAETLRGGLSLAMSGFAHWSHDIGGFEGLPDAAVFKRWTAFGLLGTHSRFHGSESYRVPWQFDDEAVEITRLFTNLKMRLMPYLFQLGLTAADTGVPVMRPMALEFPDDPAVAHLDRQYMLGSDLLVAPVFSAEGDVEFYLPGGAGPTC